MSRKYRQTAAGVWMSGNRVLASPVFYGPGWMVRDGFLIMRSSAKDPARAFRTLRARLGFPVAVLKDWKPGFAFFPPDFERAAGWSVTLETFAPSPEVEVSENM